MHFPTSFQLAPCASLCRAGFVLSSTQETPLMEDPVCLSNLELLARLVGPKTAAKIYQGSLAPLLWGCESERTHQKLLLAREFIKRTLAERMEHRDTLASPEAARDYLRLTIGRRENECFVALFLDAQNRLIAAEEIFQGTLTQTSVYPRLIVKR